MSKGHVQLTYINTKDNIADLMTESLARQLHERLAGLMLKCYKDGVMFEFTGRQALWDLF